jgi:hypothetical protein
MPQRAACSRAGCPQPAASLSADVTLPQHALDQVEHINPLGVAHLPSFFDVV